MRPFKVRTIGNNSKKVKSEIPSDSPTTVGLSSERFIDYTNFQEGFIMAYDDERNRYHFVAPDTVIEDTFKQEEKPEPFTTIVTDKVEETLNIDFGEY
jgi:hypothetical protein